MKLHQPHQPNHAKSGQGDERIDGDTVEHRRKFCFFKVGDACSKTDRRQCRATANACSCGNQVAKLPIQLEDLANEIPATPAQMATPRANSALSFVLVFIKTSKNAFYRRVL